MSENNTKACPTCLGNGWLLHVYNRGPGDAPGNRRVGCPHCEAGTAFAFSASISVTPADFLDLLLVKDQEIKRLRTWLGTIVDCHAAASELYTSYAEMADNFALRAKSALEGENYV